MRTGRRRPSNQRSVGHYDSVTRTSVEAPGQVATRSHHEKLAMPPVAVALASAHLQLPTRRWWPSGAGSLGVPASHRADSDTRSSADKPLFGTRRSRPNFLSLTLPGDAAPRRNARQVFGRGPRPVHERHCVSLHPPGDDWSSARTRPSTGVLTPSVCCRRRSPPSNGTTCMSCQASSGVIRGHSCSPARSGKAHLSVPHARPG